MKKLLCVLLALLMAASLVACGDKQEETGSADTKAAENTTEKAEDTTLAAENKTLENTADATKTYKEQVTVAIPSTVAVFDLQVKTDNGSDTMAKMVYNQLLDFDYDTRELTAELATEWKAVSASEYWFKLREDVTFSNGEKLTADDVKWTFVDRPAVTGVGTTVTKEIDSVEIVNDYEFTIKLKSNDADFLNRMYLQQQSIFNREACEADTATGHYVGTNGWAVDTFLPSDSMTLTRVDSSWVWNETGVCPTKKVVIKTMSENSTVAAGLQAGELAAAASLTSESVEAVSSNSSVEVYTFSAQTMTYMMFNFRSSKLGGSDEAHTNLRKAIAYAINRDDMNDIAFDGKAVKTNTLWGNLQYGLVDDSVFGDDVLDYNLEKSQAYLKASGIDTQGMELTIMCDSLWEGEATVLQAVLLQQFGIKLTISISDSSTVSSRANANRKGESTDDYDIIITNISLQTIGDRFHFTVNMSSATNRAAFENADILALYEEALAEVDDAKRKEMYKEIQIKMNDAMVYMPWYYEVYNVAWNTNVTGIKWNLDAKPDFSHIMWAE